jgi:hypothetical protein
MAMTHDEIVQAETEKALDYIAKAQLNYMDDAIARGVHPDYGMGAILSAMGALASHNCAMVSTSKRDRNAKLDQMVSFFRKRAALEKDQPFKAVI